MKKQFAAIFAATAVLGVTTAFAANPFSDVTPDSWAYQAVSQLAAAGIVNGYPDGTFKGQNDITRYEMAQMVAKAMANQDRANAEQQAMIHNSFQFQDLEFFWECPRFLAIILHRDFSMFCLPPLVAMILARRNFDVNPFFSFVFSFRKIYFLKSWKS